MSGDTFIALIFMGIFILALVGTPFIAALRMANKRDHGPHHHAH